MGVLTPLFTFDSKLVLKAQEPNLQQQRTSTENQKVAPGIEATFWFSVEVRGC